MSERRKERMQGRMKELCVGMDVLLIVNNDGLLVCIINPKRKKERVSE